MWNKIYLIALAVAVLIMGVLTYFSYNWLQSVTKPADVVANYEYYASFYRTFLFISSLALLILANVMLWFSRQAWALWTTLAYFSVFILLETWWLNNLFLTYQKNSNLTETTFSLMGLGGTFLCVIVAVGIFFDQFLVLRMRDRIHGGAKPIEPKFIDKEIPAAEDSTSEEI